MSLIKCPECGRENVSDSAQSCPECGYNIKQHFDSIKQVELEKKEEEQRKRKEEEQRKREREKQEKTIKCPECGEVFLESLKICPNCGLSLEDEEALKKINSIKVLEIKIQNAYSDFVKYLLMLVFSLIMFIIVCWWYFSGDENFFVVCMMLLGIVSIFGSSYGISSAKSNKEQLQDKLSLAREDYDSYLIQVEKEKQEFKKMLQQLSKSKTNIPKCPTCGSTNIRKIGTGERAASVVGLGLLSKKINKTWKCNNCGHTW